MQLGNWALLIIDLQRYYLEPQASFVRYFNHRYPGAMSYVAERCQSLVIPRLAPVVAATRRHGQPVIYLRLCGQAEDRSDLHRHFQRAYRSALEHGFSDLYPLSSQPLADVVPEVAPQPGDLVLDKTTYSGFTSSALESELRARGIETLITTGLATSQCVETTARDASDRGFQVLHLEDCQADYEDITHRASLFCSQNVCGGHCWEAADFLRHLRL
jgi:nicotinamidase-related amidase